MIPHIKLNINMNKMKRITIAALFLIGIAGSANAQLNYGLKAGLNYGGISGIDRSNLAETASGYTGFHGGIFLGAKIVAVGIQADATISTQGSTIKEAGGAAKNLQNTYLNLPVVAKFYLVPNVLNIHAGPQFSVLLNSKYDGEKTAVFDTVVQDVKDKFESKDIGMTVGIGLDLLKLQIEARYNIGLQDINSSFTSTGDELKNQVFQLSAGWKF